MPASIDFYTNGNMEKAYCSSATDAATGFPKENMMDFNPDTCWKGNVSATQILRFDLGSAKPVDSLVIFLKDYLTDYHVTKTIDIQLNASTNGTDWTTPNGELIFTAEDMENDGVQPIFIRELASQKTYRYWQITLTNITAQPQFACVFFCQKNTLDKGNQWPELDPDGFMNNHINASDGRVHSRIMTRKKIRVRNRTYLLTDDTDWNILKDAHDDSLGRFLPLIMVEGTEKIMMKFSHDELSPNQIAYKIRQPSIEMIEVPYIEDGELY